ncbi:MAG: prepilin-type N-terminal cleavage/methylation domain-containing protein [candidate division NC10 bacterium]|nr:prepilin-type N-terminal cleavage/methylation domain-containing protein [candidate division NC10 bacterium]
MTPGRVAISRQPSAVSGRHPAPRFCGSILGSRLAVAPEADPPRRICPGKTRLRRTRGSPPGFTLIELLIVITIIGILVTLAQPSYQRAVTAAKEATLKEDLFILRDTIDQFYADNGTYPLALSDLAEKRYVRRVPRDPVTGSADTWTPVYFTDEQGQQNGVFDVRSGSDAVAMDGTRYSDW